MSDEDFQDNVNNSTHIEINWIWRRKKQDHLCNECKWRKMRRNFDAEKKNEKCCHIICYENELWSEIEKKYNVRKHKYCDILKMLKKCWKYLYEV